ncbi:MAG TPA: hypothetical protein VGF85_06145 [Opitutaceae bacterium]
MRLQLGAALGCRPGARADGFRLPVALLLALLERTPVWRAAVPIVDAVLEGSAGFFLKASGVALGALGSIDSLAGATTYTLTTAPNQPSPYTVTEGSQIEAVAFALNPVTQAAPGSWTVSGAFPPGLKFGDPHSSNYLTAPGTLNYESPPVLFGTPTTAGDYLMEIQATEATGSMDGMMTTTNMMPYEVIVTGTGPTPTPTPTPTSSPNAPEFTTQPISVTVTGGTVALDAGATNGPTYQWSLNGAPVAGATGSILLVSNAGAAAGRYTCTATNGSGSATSTAAVVSLANTTNIGRLINISCRAGVGTDANILIAGFAVGGQGTTGSEPLLVRASGPALAAFGVGGTIPDPQLQLFSGSTVLGTNEGWAGNAQVAATAAAVNAFAWADTSSHDAALLETLGKGPYTAQVAGQAGDTGVALAEVYDATPAGTYTPASPRLVNISTRVQVGTGGNILIAGFVIGGSTARTVLIRASGPALAGFGVAGTIPDPQLQLFSGSTLLESNNGWGGNAKIASTAAVVGAFAWSSPTSADSALLITLPPGAYTAQVAGASGDTGVALIEVYEVP